MSFPLENARLCLDCDTVFEGPLCPSCNSETYFPLSRWIRPTLDELRAHPPRSAGQAPGKTARNASLLLAGSGLAYALWRTLASKGYNKYRESDYVQSEKPLKLKERRKKPENRPPEKERRKKPKEESS